jgi:CBS domain-containing protein
MRVDSIMKQPQACSDTDTAADCAKLMKERNIGFVPICNAAGEPVGAITDRDLAIRVLAERRSPDTKLGNVMTRDVVCCRIGDDLSAAEQLMRDHHKSRMMVCEQSGKLAGVISLSDVVEFEEDETATKTFRDVAARETQQPHAS